MADVTTMASIGEFLLVSDAWMPDMANYQEGWLTVDWAFDFIFWVSVVFFVIIVGAMSYFTLKYRRTPERQVSDPAPTHHTALELTWSILPLLLVIVIFVVGWVTYDEMRDGTNYDERIDVVGLRWKWKFTHELKETVVDESGKTTERNVNVLVPDEIHLVKGKKYELRITSTDVIHSVYIPNFRVKKDAVPGKYSKLYVKPTKAGVFPLKCTEYCGTDHARMLATVIVHDTEPERAAVLRNYEKMDSPEGTFIINCSSCHNANSVDVKNAPSLLTLSQDWRAGGVGRDGKPWDDYVRTSIRQPQAFIHPGFAGNMPGFGKDQISDEDLNALVNWIKDLSKPVSGQ